MLFTERIKKKHPDATVVNKPGIPDEMASPGYEGKYISITTLTYSSEDESLRKDWLWETDGEKRLAPLRIKKYWRHNETDWFTYDVISRKKKKQKGENEFKDLWLSRKFLRTPEKVPS